MHLRRGLCAAPTAVAIAAAMLAAVLGGPAEPAARAAAAGAATVQVKGSDTIGGKLGQDFAHAFMSRHPAVEVKWEALGSGTAFVGLLDGSAQLGASSRGVKEAEVAEAKKVGIELREFVIGYDGIAVIVNPENPVSELTIAQLSDIFTGKIKSWSELGWSEVGGPDLPIHLISRPSYSGTFSFFRDKVLRRGNDKGPEDFAATVELVEENGAIIKKVAQERGAISYVGIGWVTPQVRTVGVANRPGQPAVKASVATVRTGTYPVYRPLLIYSRGEPHGAARELLAFVLSGDGQKLVAKNDFVPTDSPVSLAPEAGGSATASAAAAGGGGPQVARVLFPKGVSLTADARQTLDGLARSAKADGRRLLVVGHADARGSRAANKGVSLARARAVATYLTEQGVPREAIQVEGHGADDPVGTNTSGAGRGANRRVDVIVLAAAAAAAPTQ
jgi:phosphate transport system substrate-binding protein